MAYRNLLLAGAILVDRLLDEQPLLLQSVHDVVHHVGAQVKADRTVDRGTVKRDKPAVHLAGQEELVLKRGFHPYPMVARSLDHALEEAARIGAPILMVESDLIAEDARARRNPGQYGEGGRVRHETDLANRLHALDRDELLQKTHRHLRAGQADPLPQLVGQASGVRGLAACHTAQIAVEESDQLDARVAGLRHNPLVVDDVGYERTYHPACPPSSSSGHRAASTSESVRSIISGPWSTCSRIIASTLESMPLQYKINPGSLHP